ncbi:hypothetical protein EX30DRAFT_180777 [Ascodesmis nigricans]|uniref:Zn(2)-C6 fungal-type domain-containing protein n=1 Tax=Ascodesmis nigricans TaxID=341454 RepID=A0A4V3SHV5_9PEZI|nr:hypothetical protein EX30DRAFT_180777 [Ascodesmis nigricans]
MTFSTGYLDPLMADVYDPGRQTRMTTHSHHHHTIRERRYGMSSHPNPRADPMISHRLPRSQAMPQAIPLLGSSGNGSQPRRRIPVACARCRKRKIRCTGDPGDNTGCANCKAARVSPGTCVFLRVSSNTLDIGPQTTSTSINTLGIHHNLSNPSLHAGVPSSRPSSHSAVPVPMHPTMDSKNYFATNTDPGLLSNGRYDTPSIILGSRTYDNIAHHDLSSYSGNVSGPPNPGSLYSSSPPYMLQSNEDTTGHGSQAHPSYHSQTDFRPEWSTSSAGNRNTYTTAPAQNYSYVDLNTSNSHLAPSYSLSTTSSPSLPRSVAPTSSVSAASPLMVTLPTTTGVDSFPVFPALSVLHSSLPSNDHKALPPLNAGHSKSDYRSFETYRPTTTAYDSNSIPALSSVQGSDNDVNSGTIPASTTHTSGHNSGASTPPLSTTPASSVSRSSSRISLHSVAESSANCDASYTTSSNGLRYQYVNAQRQDVRVTSSSGAVMHESRRMTPVST